MNINPNQIQIRTAGISDLPVITEIYNEAILNGVATFDTIPKTLDERFQWLNSRRKINPVFVACIEDKIVGWSSLNAWSDRAAYDGTAEVSVYIHQNYRGQGIGSLMLSDLVKQAEFLGLHYLLARITQGNETSIHLHQRNGFQIIGTMHEVGYKFGSFLNVTLMEKVFKSI